MTWPTRKRRDVLPLRREQQLRRRLAHLPDAARRRLKLQREDGLHRVDDDQRRLDARDLLENALEAGFGEQIERRAADREPLAARLDLMLGLLARAVEDRAAAARHVRGGLQQQRRLADAGLAAEEDQRSRHDAAAEDAIELVDAGREPRMLLDVDVRIEACRARAAGKRVAMAPPAAAAGSGCGRSSTNEFHAPQSPHRPSHLGDCEPHSWQTKTVLGGLAIGTSDYRTVDFPGLTRRLIGGSIACRIEAWTSETASNRSSVKNRDGSSADSVPGAAGRCARRAARLGRSGHLPDFQRRLRRHLRRSARATRPLSRGDSPRPRPCGALAVRVRGARPPRADAAPRFAPRRARARWTAGDARRTGSLAAGSRRDRPRRRSVGTGDRRRPSGPVSTAGGDCGHPRDRCDRGADGLARVEQQYLRRRLDELGRGR